MRVILAEIVQLDALAAQPLHEAAAFLRDRARDVVSGIALGDVLDLADEFVLGGIGAGEIDVERAVGVARIADVLLFRALLENRRALAEFRRAVCRDHAGDAAADDDDVEFRISLVH